MLRLGIDVDGVVADFRAAFHALAGHESTSRQADRGAELSKTDVEGLWKAVAARPNWWMDLPAYEPEAIAQLYALARRGRWEVFFLTSRPPSAGDSVQIQTQVWLERFGFYLPAVLTAPAGARGELARALRLDLVMDDRLADCLEVVAMSNAKALLVARDEAAAHREAAESRGVGVVASLAAALEAVERLESRMATRRGRLVRLSDWFLPSPGDPVLPSDPRARREPL